MSDKRQRDEPKQTTPKGQEILVPKRGEFLGNLRKVAKTVRSGDDAGSRPKQ